MAVQARQRAHSHAAARRAGQELPLDHYAQRRPHRLADRFTAVPVARRRRAAFRQGSRPLRLQRMGGRSDLRQPADRASLSYPSPLVEQFGRYQLLRKLGTGGMAEVYLARTPLAQGLQKLLVVKKIHPAYAQTSQFRVMFRHEAEAAMNLNHPNIVQVFEWGELPAHYLAKEYVEGVDLMRLGAAAQHAGRRVPYGLAAYVVQQMAKGLD